MDLQTIIFYFFAGLTLLGAGIILLTRNVLYAAFALMLCFLGVAGLYVFAGADFVAATQIMVYVGGILILIVFGVMLTNRLGGSAVLTDRYRMLGGSLLSILLLIVLLQAIFSQPWKETAWLAGRSPEASEVKSIGLLLMSDYVIAFELAGLLLLMALIASAFLARESAQSQDIKEEGGL